MAPALRLALIVAIAAAGLFAPALLGGTGAVYSAAVLIAIFAVMAYGLDMIVSDLGEVSLAHTVFFAIGAYAAAMLATRLGLGPVATLLGAIILAVVAAAILGVVTLRLKEFVFSLVTYAVAVVAMTVAANWEFLGGSDGLRGIPPFTLAPLGLRAETDAQLWPVAYGLLLVTLYLMHAFRRSRLGQAAVMVHLNPRLATMSGIDPKRTRLQIFLLSAPVTAAAGWLYAYQRSFVSADLLETYFLILMLTSVVLVGRRLLLGPLIGVALVQIQEKFFSFGGYVDKIVLGSVLVVVLAFLPGGLVGLGRSLVALGRRRGESVAGSMPDVRTVKD
ncbi:branched-chain amino acid ABC transporter permease [Chelatococcus reniformis]|uniref:Branched-chain amino acid ABC transporter permease n=1 Tax=Chelatococcus reniformis TaxID=1494448 RepID=A0A916UQI0_9HYPH|nr:branched-chain amino acid ABC transporter permease [Chelatococcus reniformis]GGC82887.1 branched-chain amino acid ABC transporter permease [Chelatococcus reniformis]